MTRALILGSLAAIAVCWTVVAAPPVINSTVAIVDAFAPSQQATVNASGQLNVNCAAGCAGSSVIAGTFTSRSGSVATGGTSQQIMAANASRKRVLIQNPCTAASQGIGAAENLFINFTAAANATNGSSLELTPCGAYDSGAGPVTTEAITVVGATSGHLYVAKEE